MQNTAAFNKHLATLVSILMLQSRSVTEQYFCVALLQLLRKS